MMWYYMYPSLEKVKNLPFYLISIGLHELQPAIEKKQGHEFDQFFFNACGSGTLELNGKTSPLPEGSAFFIPAHVPHKYYPDGDIWDIRWMVPGGYALNDLYKNFNIEKGGVFDLKDESKLDIILNQMRTDLITNPTNGPILAAGNVYNFIIEFINQTSLAKEEIEEKPYGKQIMLLKDYISNHFMYPISLDDLCKILSVSKQHLCRIFNENMGMRPVEYINSVRINMAKGLLLYSTDSVETISNKCGFKNCNYFCKIFKELEKRTPTEYRKSVLTQ